MKKWNNAFPAIRRIENGSVNVICFGLLVASVFFAVCIILVMCCASCNGGWHFCLGPDSIKNMQDFWVQYTPLIKAFFASVTLFVASHSLMKYIDVERTRSLGEIREKLDDKPKKIIHDYVMNNKDKEGVPSSLIQCLNENSSVDLSTVEIFDYLGTLELGAIMLYRGVISEEEFYNQFGYRYENVEESFLYKVANESPEYYQPLLYALSVIHKRRQK